MLREDNYWEKVEEIGNLVYTNLFHKWRPHEMYDTAWSVLTSNYKEWLDTNGKYIFLYTKTIGKMADYKELIYGDICNYIDRKYSSTFPYRDKVN